MMVSHDPRDRGGFSRSERYLRGESTISQNANIFFPGDANPSIPKIVDVRREKIFDSTAAALQWTLSIGTSEKTTTLQQPLSF